MADEAVFMYFGTDTKKGVAVKGSSTDERVTGKDAMELTSFAFAGDNSTNVGSQQGGGSGAGRVTFAPVSCAKYAEGGTPGLYNAMTQNSHFDTVTVEFYRSQELYMKKIFKKVLVAHMDTTAGMGEAMDSFTLDWGAVTYEWYEQDSQGKIKKTQEVKWSRIKNNNSDTV